MSNDPIDAILARYEQSLAREIDSAAANAATVDSDLRAWRATKDRIRPVLEQIQKKLEDAEHSAGVTEGDDLIEITFRARTNRPDRTGVTTFERKGSGVMVTNKGPDKVPVGGGMQTHAQLTESRIREHVSASLAKTLELNG